MLWLGAVVATILSAVVIAGAAWQVWWLLAAGLATFLSLILIVALDVDRRVRRMRPLAHRLGARERPRRPGATSTSTSASVSASATTEFDVIGTVRLLQAQYVGRLDRMQSTLDRALTELSRQRRDDA